MLVVPPLGVVLFGAGQNVGAGYLLVLAGALLAAAPWSWWVARRAARTVEVRRVLPASAQAGDPVEVVLHVRAASRGAVVVRDLLTGTVGVVEAPGAGDELRARVPLRRGAATTGEVTAEVSDPLGLVRVTATGDVPGRIEVVPEAVRADVRFLVGLGGRSERQEQRARGVGARTDGTREYRRGDPVRSVHWRSSARRDELVVRRLVGEAAGLLRVVVDRGAWTVDALDVACVALGCVADGALEAGLEVELEVGGSVLPWGAVAGRRVLAHLRPNLGCPDGDGSPDLEAPGLAAAREATSSRGASATVRFRPHGAVAGVVVEVGTSTQAMVALPSSTEREVVRRWVEDALGRPSGRTGAVEASAGTGGRRWGG